MNDDHDNSDISRCYSFTWTIDAFSTRSGRISSPDFRYPQTQCRFGFTLSTPGSSRTSTSAAVSLTVHSFYRTFFKVYILTPSGKHQVHESRSWDDFIPTFFNYEVRINSLISLDELFNPDNGFLVDDRLTIICTVFICHSEGMQLESEIWEKNKRQTAALGTKHANYTALLSTTSPLERLRRRPKQRLAGKIKYLPDQCLIALFKYLPLVDQITVRRACRHWTTRSASEEATSSIHSITLLIGNVTKANPFAVEPNRELLVNDGGQLMFPEQHLTQWNSLKFDSLDEDIVLEIASTFPAVTCLHVAINSDNPGWTFTLLAGLLELWADQLITLKVYEEVDNTNDQQQQHLIGHLFWAINSLPALKYLHLELNTFQLSDLPIISQLIELSLYVAHSSAAQTVRMLQRYGETNDELQCLDYRCSGTVAAVGLPLFAALSDRLRRCFRQLSFKWPLLHNPTFICTYFPSLTSLDIAPMNITFRHLFEHLAKLPQLLSLCLNIDFTRMLPNEEVYFVWPTLSNVKELALYLRLCSHKCLDQMYLGWTTPQVQVIDFDFKHYGDGHCTTCRLDSFAACQDDPAQLKKMKNCFRQLFAPLKRDCFQLRMIRHSDEAVLGTAEQLLAGLVTG